MIQSMHKKLEGNIVKYNLLKIFTKRVFLPLIAIFLVDVGNVSLTELGIIASVTGIVSIILEVPTGYLSDKLGHKSSLVFGNALCALSTLFYIFMPSFLGGLLASVVFFAGCAFSSGTTQAFIHETLMAIGRESEYARIMGRAQSYGLLGNVLLISVVPLTYQINHTLPFFIGFLCLLTACIITASFVSPPPRVAVHTKINSSLRSLIGTLPRYAFLRLLMILLIFGISSAGFDSSFIYREVIFRDVGIPVNYFGFILAIGSLFAAIVGQYIHHLKKISPERFYLFDIVYICVALFLVGFTSIPAVIVFAFVLFPTYDRTRNIIFESHLFEEFPNSKYKATLVSVLNFFPLLGNSVAPILLAALISGGNILGGYLKFSLLLATALLIILFFHNYFKHKEEIGFPQKESAL